MAAVAALAWSTAIGGGPSRYELDPVHTRILFIADHAGYSSALGTISGSTGTLSFDPEDWQAASLEVSIPLERLDLGDAGWNAATHRMLESARFPTARFVSNRVEPVDNNAARVCGDLTLHGVTRDWCMDVRFNQLRRYPLPPFRRTAGFSATGQLQRSAFGIDRWPRLVGDLVELRIEAEARDLGAGPVPPPEVASPAGEDDAVTDADEDKKDLPLPAPDTPGARPTGEPLLHEPVLDEPLKEVPPSDAPDRHRSQGSGQARHRRANGLSRPGLPARTTGQDTVSGCS